MKKNRKSLISLYFTHTVKFMLWSFIFLTFIKPAYANDYNESYKILKQAVQENTDLGYKMNKEKLHLQLLSMKVKDNIPFLVETLNSSNKPEFRYRAFFTLALMGPDEHFDSIRKAMDDPKLNAGELCYLLAKANPGKYKSYILEEFNKLLGKQRYSLSVSRAVEGLVLMGGADVKKILMEYYRFALEDPSLTTKNTHMMVVNDALYNTKKLLKYENTCRDLLRKLMQVKYTPVSIPAACTLHDYGSESESRKFFIINGKTLEASRDFDRYHYYIQVLHRMNRDFGTFLLKNAIKNENITPAIKIRLMAELAKLHDKEAQEWLKDMFRDKEENFEEALWLLAVYYNEKWIMDKIPKLYEEDFYWTPAGAKKRSFLARAYLVMSDKRSVGFFKRMLTDVNRLKRVYACEGLRFQNARGTKPELISLFRNIKYEDPMEQAVAFQCARALFRFGRKDFFDKLMEVKSIPMKNRQLALASIGDTGDKEDIELLKHIREKLQPELYDSYMYALIRIARQETDPLMAENRGVKEEPLRDSRLLMKQVLDHPDINFRRKGAGYIEFFTYHWQSVPLLKDCVQSNDSETKIQGILSFRNVTDNITAGKAQDAMRRCLTDPDFRVKTATAAVLSILENRKRGQTAEGG